jgi:hypothetical protein
MPSTPVDLALMVAVVGALGSFFAVKFGGAETQRLVKALHMRFDGLEHDFRKLETEHARLEERVRGLKDSQRFRSGKEQQDMFVVDE